MKLENIGRQIKILRGRAGMSRKKLCDGLCSESELVFIEKGESAADLILLVALLERLGKSAERLTYILTIKEYQRFAARDEIEDALRLGDLLKAEKIFEHYRKNNPVSEGKKNSEKSSKEKKNESDKILFMYEEKILGIFALEEYEDLCNKNREDSERAVQNQNSIKDGGLQSAKLEVASKHLKNAILQTLSYKELFNGKLIKELDGDEKLLAMFEIENILLFLSVQEKQGKWQGHLELLTALYRYLEKNAQDDELRAQYLAKVGILLGGLYLKRKELSICIEMHEKILDLNREYGMIVCILPILEQIITAYKKQGNIDRARFYTVHKENFKAVFYEFHLRINCVNKLYYTCKLRQYFVEGKLISAERRWKGISQTELIDGIYRNPENLSRIEIGKANADRKKFYALMERLGVDKTRYNGNLFTDEYQVLELDRNIEKHLAKKQYEEVGHELYLLEKSVDMKEKCNQQLVLGLKNGEAFRDGKITCKEALKKANELLEMTYHLENTEKDRMQYRRIPFRNEMYLFNQICILLRRDGRIGEAIELLERMMRTYDGAVEKRKYHFKDVSLCQTNLSKWMEMENRLEEAENIANKAIREKLVCGNINFIHRLLATKFDIVEKQNNNVLYHKGWLRWAYFLSEWCNDEKDSQILQKAIKENKE